MNFDRGGVRVIFLILLLAGHEVAAVYWRAKSYQTVAFWAVGQVAASRHRDVYTMMNTSLDQGREVAHLMRHEQLAEAPKAGIAQRFLDGLNALRVPKKAQAEEQSPRPKFKRSNAFSEHDCDAKSCEAMQNSEKGNQCSYKTCVTTQNQPCPSKVICRGTFKILCNWKKVSGSYMNLTQIPASGFQAMKAAGKHVQELEEVMPHLADLAPLGPAGAFGGAISNALSLIEMICKGGMIELKSCKAGVSFLATALAVCSLFFFFTGLGVPLSALANVAASIFVRKVGNEICKHGMKKWASNFFLGIPYEQQNHGIKEALVDKFADSGLADGDVKKIVGAVVMSPLIVMKQVLRLTFGLVKHLVYCVLSLLATLAREAYTAAKYVQTWAKAAKTNDMADQVNPSCCALLASMDELEEALSSKVPKAQAHLEEELKDYI